MKILTASRREGGVGSIFMSAEYAWMVKIENKTTIGDISYGLCGTCTLEKNYRNEGHIRCVCSIYLFALCAKIESSKVSLISFKNKQTKQNKDVENLTPDCSFSIQTSRRDVAAHKTFHRMNAKMLLQTILILCQHTFCIHAAHTHTWNEWHYSVYIGFIPILRSDFNRLDVILPIATLEPIGTSNAK